MHKHLIRSSFLIFILMSLLIIPFVMGQTTTVKLVVATSNARVRAQATSTSEQVGSLNTGESAVWLGENPSGESVNGSSLWYNIRLATGIEGWVWSGVVRIEEVIPTPTPTPHPTLPPNETYQTISIENADKLQSAYEWGRGLPQNIAWSLDGSQLLVASSTGLWLHDAQNISTPPQKIADFSTRRDNFTVVTQLGFIPDSTNVYAVFFSTATGGNLVFQIYNLEDGELGITYNLETFASNWRNAGTTQAVSLHPNGRTLAMISPDGVRLINLLFHARTQTITNFDDIGQLGQGTPSTSVLFNSDGSQLAVMSGNGTSIYTMPDQTLLASSRDSGAYALFTPDSASLILMGSNMRFISLNPTTGGQNFRYERTGYSFYSAAMHPTKSEFATAIGRIPYGAYIYDATQETEPPRYAMRTSVHVVAYSPDGSYLAGVSKTGAVINIWDTETGEIAQSDTTIYSHHGAIQFIQDGAQMVVSGGNRLDFYNPNTNTGDLIRSVSYPEWDSFDGVVNPNGDRIWASVLLPVGMTFEAVIRSFDLNGIPLTDEIRLDANVGGGIASSPIIDLIYSPDGQFIITTERNGSIRFRNPETFEPVNVVYHPNGGINARLQFATFGDYFVTYGEDDETVRVWTKQGLSVATFDIPPSDQQAFGITGLSISADGGRVAYSGGTDIYVWDVQTSTRIFEMKLDAGNIIGTIALHPDGDILAISNSSTGVLFLYDVNTGEELVRRPAARILSTLAFTPDGALLIAIGREDGIIRFWGVSR